MTPALARIKIGHVPLDLLLSVRGRSLLFSLFPYPPIYFKGDGVFIWNIPFGKSKTQKLEFILGNSAQSPPIQC
jgi:hypothetical protein